MDKPNILHIETATLVCSVALSSGGELLATRELDEPNIHASRLTVLIDEVLSGQGVPYTALDAVSVSKGPGSYTGLRIGVSTAKGLCYALDLPLIAVSTLDAMVNGFSGSYAPHVHQDTTLMPMIDARRMEVYTAAYQPDLSRVGEVSAQVIDDSSFSGLMPHQQVVLFGSGAEKFEHLFSKNKNNNVVIVNGFRNSASHMVGLAFRHFQEKRFENVAYFEPYYLKDFVATTPKAKRT